MVARMLMVATWTSWSPLHYTTSLLTYTQTRSNALPVAVRLRPLRTDNIRFRSKADQAANVANGWKADASVALLFGRRSAWFSTPKARLRYDPPHLAGQSRGVPDFAHMLIRNGNEEVWCRTAPLNDFRLELDAREWLVIANHAVALPHFGRGYSCLVFAMDGKRTLGQFESWIGAKLIRSGCSRPQKQHEDGNTDQVQRDSYE
jgi:hypothetical protein